MTSIRTEDPEDDFHIIRHQLKKRDESYHAEVRKGRRIELLSLVLMSCTLMFAGCLALEQVLKREAVINQENVVAWKR